MGDEADRAADNDMFDEMLMRQEEARAGHLRAAGVDVDGLGNLDDFDQPMTDEQKGAHWAQVLGRSDYWEDGKGQKILIVTMDQRYRQNIRSWLRRRSATLRTFVQGHELRHVPDDSGWDDDYVDTILGEESPDQWLYRTPLFRALIEQDIKESARELDGFKF